MEMKKIAFFVLFAAVFVSAVMAGDATTEKPAAGAAAGAAPTTGGDAASAPTEAGTTTSETASAPAPSGAIAKLPTMESCVYAFILSMLAYYNYLH